MTFLFCNFQKIQFLLGSRCTIKLERSCSLVHKADDSQPRDHVFKTQPSTYIIKGELITTLKIIKLIKPIFKSILSKLHLITLQKLLITSSQITSSKTKIHTDDRNSNSCQSYLCYFFPFCIRLKIRQVNLTKGLFLNPLAKY